MKRVFERTGTGVAPAAPDPHYIKVVYYRNGIRYDWLRGRSPRFIKLMIQSLGRVQNLRIVVE